MTWSIEIGQKGSLCSFFPFNEEFKKRTITISSDEISISNFLNGGKETLYLVVNKIDEKDYSFEGRCKFYYCTAKNKDVIIGHQKVIIIKSASSLYLGLFASDIDVYRYEFGL